LGFLVRGFTFLAGHPRLWLFAVMPTVINLILLAAMIAALAHYFGDVYGWLSAHLGLGGFESPAAWWQHALNWLACAADLVFKAFLVLLSLVLLLIVSYAASFIVAGPFNDALSERVETIATGSEPPPFTLRKFVSDLWRTIRVESIKASILIAIPVGLLVVAIIPVVGGPIYAALTFLFGAWDLGLSYADLPFGRRAATFGERRDFAIRERWALVGLGAGFVVPFFALIFAPPMVVGGTLLYIERAPQEAKKRRSQEAKITP
jgi:CysZ protein